MAQTEEQSTPAAAALHASPAPVSSTQTTSQRILASAKALFLAAGYDGVNLDQVARHAGVSRQTVYNNFGSKQAVFRAVVQQHWTSFHFDGDPHVATTDAVNDPEASLRRFAAALVAFVGETDQVAFSRLVVAESRHSPWVAEDFYRLGKQPLLRMLTDLLARLTHARLLACPDPHIAARQFLGLIQEFVVWPHVMAIGPSAEQLPAADVVVNEALLTFLARYRHPVSIERRAG